MDASRSFMVVAIALTACMGATLLYALVPTDGADALRPASRLADASIAETLRPSLVPPFEPLSVAPTFEADPTARFNFVPQQAVAMWLPSENAAASGGDAWAAEVKSESVATLRSWVILPYAVAKAASAAKRRYTLKGKLKEIAPIALARVQAKFDNAKVQWPPAELAYVAIKDERWLEVYARSKLGNWSFVHRYKVLGASGKSGPKLVRGDKQVPEGVYRISYLNPNSAYHVSMRVSYPNAFDRDMAAKDGRKDLGGDIMIHGKNLSAGCLAVGDESAEELFVLANEVGPSNVTVLIAPTDLRSKEPPSRDGSPAWVPKLYAELSGTMARFKAPPPPPQPSLLSLLGL